MTTQNGRVAQYQDKDPEILMLFFAGLLDLFHDHNHGYEASMAAAHENAAEHGSAWGFFATLMLQAYSAAKVEEWDTALKAIAGVRETADQLGFQQCIIVTDLWEASVREHAGRSGGDDCQNRAADHFDSIGWSEMAESLRDWDKKSPLPLTIPGKANH
jgi:hypothetical protein